MKSKLSRRNQLLLKANKILKDFYSLGRDLTEKEIVLEVSGMLRKWDDAIFLVNYNWVHKLNKEEWEEIISKQIYENQN